METDEAPRRPAQEPTNSRPEQSISTPLVVWVMLAVLAVAGFAAAALLLGGRLG